MRKIFHSLPKFLLIVLGIFYLLCLVAVGYVIHVHQGLEIWKVLIQCSVFTLIPGSMIFMLWKSSKNDSAEDLKREKSVMDDVMNVRKGKYLNTKTNLGKWYLGAFIAIVLFPAIGRIIGKFIDSAETQQNILLILGYIMIISFIIGIVSANKRNAKNKNTKT